MNKYLYIISVILFSSCAVKKDPITEKKTDSYLVEKIRKKGEWYMIYASKEDTLYKIISKKSKDINGLCTKIKRGKEYDFILQSEKNFAPTIDGIKINPVNFSGCYYYSGNTLICLEPENGIWELYTAENIKGLIFCE